jgi:hypothetical protein
MPDPVKITGKAGKVKLATVAVATLTDWDSDLAIDFANATDASCYDATTGRIWTQEEDGESRLGGTIKGNLNLADYTAQFLDKVLAGDPVPIELWFDDTHRFAGCDAKLKGFKTGAVLTGANMVGFECAYSSYGIPTFGNPPP